MTSVKCYPRQGRGAVVTGSIASVASTACQMGECGKEEWSRIQKLPKCSESANKVSEHNLVPQGLCASVDES